MKIKNPFKKKKVKKPSPPLKGFIDCLEAGQLQGWCIDEHCIDESLDVFIYANNTLLAKGHADLERADLQDAFNSSHHGFKISLNECFEQCIGQEIKLFLGDGRPIFHNTFSLTLSDGMFWGGASNMDNGFIKGNIISESFNGCKEIIIYDESLEVERHAIDLIPGENIFEFGLPLMLLDNDIHLISIGLSGYPLKLWQGTQRIKALNTPWQHLKNNYKKSGIIGLSTFSSFHYDSLQLQLDAIKNNQSPFTIEQITTAHDVVTEGFEERKKYPSLMLPVNHSPDVSIIIPAYNKFELTYHAIASILLAFNKASYEVIVADDCSTDETQNILAIVDHVRVVKTTENLMFLRNCNNAAKQAKGQFFIFLNNDTEVTSGWIDALLMPFSNNSNVAITGSKLLNGNGSLQEAGGIVWQEGNPWNVGNGDNPMRPEYNYLRQADYVSGAALCIHHQKWIELEGFSEEFAPAYYEDTDLCFKARNKGYEVVYTPLSQVIHFEGMSNGRDLSSGVKRYQQINEKTFKEKWQHIYNQSCVASLEQLHTEKDRHSCSKRILVIDYATPNPASDAGSYAAIQEIKLLQKLGFKVTFIPENMAFMGHLTRQMQAMGIEVLYAPFYSSVFDAIEKRIGEFDAFYITRYRVAEKYISSIKSRSNKKIIFNNADLHFLRELRAAHTSGEVSLESALDTRSREIEVMKKVDAILSYNESEHAVIASHTLNPKNIFKCPWVLTEKPPTAPFHGRKGIAFLGGYRHHPNVEGVKFFAKQVMPLVNKKRSDIVFHIYGSHPSEEVKALADNHVKVVGFVENLDDVFQTHKIFIASLISGAGIKGKVLEAMAYGTPSVLTSVAAESTGLVDKMSASITDSAESMAEAVIALYDDEECWSLYSKNARITAENKFSEDVGLEQMQNIISYIENDIQEQKELENA